jgi:hypothetical protein
MGSCNKCGINNGCTCDSALKTVSNYIADGTTCSEEAECAETFGSKCISVEEEISCNDNSYGPGGLVIEACTRVYYALQQIILWLCGPIFTYRVYASDESGTDFSFERFLCEDYTCSPGTPVTTTGAVDSTINLISISDCDSSCTEVYSHRVTIQSDQSGSTFLQYLDGFITFDAVSGATTDTDYIYYSSDDVSGNYVEVTLNMTDIANNYQNMMLYYPNATINATDYDDLLVQLQSGDYGSITLTEGEEITFKVYPVSFSAADTIVYMYPIYVAMDGDTTATAAIPTTVQLDLNYVACTELCYKADLITNTYYDQNDLDASNFTGLWEQRTNSTCACCGEGDGSLEISNEGEGINYTRVTVGNNYYLPLVTNYTETVTPTYSSGDYSLVAGPTSAIVDVIVNNGIAHIRFYAYISTTTTADNSDFGFTLDLENIITNIASNAGIATPSAVTFNNPSSLPYLASCNAADNSYTPLGGMLVTPLDGNTELRVETESSFINTATSTVEDIPNGTNIDFTIIGHLNVELNNFLVSF